MIDHDNLALHEAFLASSRKHILMLTNHGVHQWRVIPGLPDTGGQNVFVNQFCAALARFGFRITIVNRGGYAHPTTNELQRGIRYFDDHQRILYIEDDVAQFVRKEDMAAQIPALTRFLNQALVDQGEIDLIISHYWDAAQLGVAYNNDRGAPIKHIWVPHSLGAIKKHNETPDKWADLRVDERIDAESALLADLDGVAATSSAISKSLHGDYNYAGPLFFLPPCVDPQRYYPRHQVPDDDPVWPFLAQRCGLTPEEIRNCKIVTEISRTDVTKRKHVLIEAFARVRWKVPNCLLILSVSEQRQQLASELAALVADLGVSDHVAMVGSVWDELPTLYAVSDVYCTPSVMEGFGMSAQEAAATKVPVVASHLVPFVVEHLLGPYHEEITTSGGSLLRRGGGAIVVPADDTDGFAEALSMLLTDEPLRQAMADSAYRLTIPHFTWGHIVDDFIQKVGVIEQQLTRSTLAHVLQYEKIDQVPIGELVGAIRAEPELSDHLPDGLCQIDPRNGDRILFNAARARRPHDNHPAAEMILEDSDCLLCQGKTTGVIDVAELSEGFTFINKNLLPILFPEEIGDAEVVDGYASRRRPDGLKAAGIHLLQWTSSIHSKDWQNMPAADRLVVMQRLAALEHKLLETSGDADRPGYVSVIKNYGRLVGGSMVHGHQQIGWSNVVPRRIGDNWRFLQTYGEPFSKVLLSETPDELLVRDYGPAALVVPYFMRRPFDMMLVMRDAQKQHLHQLDDDELRAAAEGWHDAIRAMLWVMPKIGRETAYNVVTHNGPGAGLYFEFLPYTQELGGFEQLGLYVCQGSPQNCAVELREFLARN